MGDISDRLIDLIGHQAATSEGEVFGTTPICKDNNRKIDLQFAAPLIIVPLVKVIKTKTMKTSRFSRTLKHVKCQSRMRKLADLQRKLWVWNSSEFFQMQDVYVGATYRETESTSTRTLLVRN